MSISMATTLRNARLNQITAAIDAGAGAGTLKLYTGPRPASGAAITSETLLATLTFSDPSAGAASAGVLTLDTITDDTSADASGTAVWARIQDSDAAFVMDLDVGAAGSGADIELVSTTITAGQAVGIASATITEANA
jgi:hypothetical protein